MMSILEPALASSLGVRPEHTRRRGLARRTPALLPNRRRCGVGLHVTATDGAQEEESPRSVDRHWSQKLRGATTETTRDDLRYMSSKAASAVNADNRSLSQRVLSVRRDRDNVILVADDRLVLPFLAEALKCDHDAAVALIDDLCSILPPMRKRLGAVGIPTLASMCSDLPGLSRRLLSLKALFPNCDIFSMVCVSPHLLSDDLDEDIAPNLAGEALEFNMNNVQNPNERSIIFVR